MLNVVRGLLGLCRSHRSSVILWTCRRCTGPADDDLPVDAPLLLGLNLIANNPPRRRIRLQRIQHLLPLGIWIRLGRRAHHTLRIAQRSVWILTQSVPREGAAYGRLRRGAAYYHEGHSNQGDEEMPGQAETPFIGAISTQPASCLACIDLVNEDLRICKTSITRHQAQSLSAAEADSRRKPNCT